MVAVTHAVLSADGGVGLKINGTTVVQGQEANVPDAANATAAAAANTQSAPPAGGTGNTAGAYDTAANRNLMITSLTAARTDIAAQKVELDKLITDVGLIRAALNLVIGRLEGHGLLAS